MNPVDEAIMKKARQWMEGDFDEETRNQVKTLMENDPKELTEAFYRDLEFGTGGLRGIMGVGTNRMNKYTVGMATQGFANYLKQSFPEKDQIRVAIAHDCRNNSTFFTEITAEIFSANGFKVFLFDALRPTPQLSFAIRHLGCQGGVMITASHNPKEYNGYKVYWEDGGQLIVPHDKNVIREVQKIKELSQVRFSGKEKHIETLGAEIDEAYIEAVKGVSLSPELCQKHQDLKIVFTPIHGTAVKLAPMALNAYGFKKVFSVPEQDVVSGDFPTVVSPNPEESAALKMALEKAEEVDADLVMATDPDADRVGVAVKDKNGKYLLLNGNQTATILIYYLLEKWKEKEKLTGKEYIVKTIVTTELLKKMALSYGVDCYDVLTGFKFIAEKIRLLEGKKTFIGGGEESYGYLVGDFVRDKDAIVSCCIIAEAAAWARENGKTLYELLIDIYVKFDLHYEKLLSLTKKGKAGMEEIQQMMEKYRKEPPGKINGQRIATIKDYKAGVEKDMFYVNKHYPIDLPSANVLQFLLEDGSKITMRPSGTEPKIKFYFGSEAALESAEEFENTLAKLEDKIDSIIESMKLE